MNESNPNRCVIVPVLPERRADWTDADADSIKKAV